MASERQKMKRYNRGFLLVVISIMTAGMLLFVLIILRRSVMEVSAARQYVSSIRAFHLAEGGLDQAYERLRRMAQGPQDEPLE